MQISVIIVNWNTGARLMDCIDSIAKYHHNLVSSVIIVDNASTDNSLVQIEAIKNLPFQLEIIRNPNNRGFSAACNQGAEKATSEYLLFLNPDTRLFDNSLLVPIAYLQESCNKTVGIVGIQLLDELNCISKSCARFPTLSIFMWQALGINRLPGLRHLNTHMSDWEHDETRAVDHVIGAYYLMRCSLFNKLAGFDERFFVYLEDLDFSLRVQKAGYQSVYLAEAQAFHAGGGASRQVKAHRLFYSLRSRLLYSFKHFRFWQAWIVVLITLSVESVTRTIFSLIYSGLDGISNTWYAYYMLWGDMRLILRKSRQ